MCTSTQVLNGIGTLAGFLLRWRQGTGRGGRHPSQSCGLRHPWEASKFQLPGNLVSVGSRGDTLTYANRFSIKAHSITQDMEVKESSVPSCSALLCFPLNGSVCAGKSKGCTFATKPHFSVLRCSLPSRRLGGTSQWPCRLVVWEEQASALECLCSSRDDEKATQVLYM